MCAIDITAEQRKTVLALLARHLPNTTAWVYASRVKWTARPESDLDLVVFATPEQAGRVSDLREAFEESNLPFRVDLFVWDTVPQQFRKAIEAEHVVLVERRELGRGGGWRVDSVGDFFDLVTGYAFKSSDFSDDGIPVVKIKNVKAGHFSKHQFSYVSPDFLDTRSEKIALVDDLLISMSGNRHDGSPETWVGKVALFREEDAYLINQRVGALRLKRNAGLDARFASFLLSSYPYEELFISIATSSGGQANLSPEQILGAPVRYPEIGEQRSIAHILGTLDDKIELNRRMNRTLEEMARVLFKSWFVDFDPVRAKATLKHHDTNHSPLEGESARQGRSPQSSRWGEIKRSYTQQTLERAKTLRQYQTDAEGLLWHYLRNKQLDGYKFRRQLPIGPYIVDFACLSRKLVIELDGGQHAEQHNHDKKREDYLRGKGYKILRFWNNEVFQNCMDVLEAVYQALVGPPPHQPSPGGLASATPPQGGSDWSAERARAYLDRMDPSIAALFPDRFVDSELGPIPEGWEVKRIEDIAERVAMGPFGSSIKVSTFVDEGIPVISGQHLNGMLLNDNEYRFIREEHAKKLAKANVQRGDVIFTHAGSIGQVACIPQTSQFERYVISQRQFYMRCDVSQISPLFVVHFFKTPKGRHQLLANTSSTGVPSISRPVTYLRSIILCTPPNALWHRFNEIARGLHLKVGQNTKESRSLTALRDVLLPKLISGKMRVKDEFRR